MTVNTEYLSTETTVLSDTSFSGVVKLGVIESRSNLSVAAVTGTTGRFTSTLSADGNTKLGGTLDAAAITGTTGRFTSTLSAAGNTKLGGTLDVDSTIGSDSQISGAHIKGTSGQFTTSLVTINTATFLSTLTAANAVGMTANQWRAVFTTSGLSMIYCSGTSIYDIGSNTSAATPT